MFGVLCPTAAVGQLLGSSSGTSDTFDCAAANEHYAIEAMVTNAETRYRSDRRLAYKTHLLIISSLLGLQCHVGFSPAHVENSSTFSDATQVVRASRDILFWPCYNRARTVYSYISYQMLLLTPC